MSLRSVKRHLSLLSQKKSSKMLKQEHLLMVLSVTVVSKLLEQILTRYCPLYHVSAVVAEIARLRKKLSLKSSRFSLNGFGI